MFTPNAATLTLHALTWPPKPKHIKILFRFFQKLSLARREAPEACFATIRSAVVCSFVGWNLEYGAPGHRRASEPIHIYE